MRIYFSICHIYVEVGFLVPVNALFILTTFDLARDCIYVASGASGRTSIYLLEKEAFKSTDIRITS